MRNLTDNELHAAEVRRRMLARAYGPGRCDSQPLLRLGPDGRQAYTPALRRPLTFGDGFMCGALLGAVVLIFVLLL